jgi:hypothetical protein
LRSEGGSSFERPLRLAQELLDGGFKFGAVDDAGVGEGDASVAVDEEGEGHLVDVVLGAERIVADGDGVAHACLLHEGPHLAGSFTIHIDADELEALGAIRLVEGDVPGDFNFAAAAVDGPEVEEDDAASILGEGERLAVEIGEEEIGGGPAGVGRDEGVRIGSSGLGRLGGSGRGGGRREESGQQETEDETEERGNPTSQCGAWRNGLHGDCPPWKATIFAVLERVDQGILLHNESWVGSNLGDPWNFPNLQKLQR